MINLSHSVFISTEECNLVAHPSVTGTSKTAVLHLTSPDFLKIKQDFTEDQGVPSCENHVEVGIPFEFLDMIAERWPKMRRSLEIPE